MGEVIAEKYIRFSKQPGRINFFP